MDHERGVSRDSSRSYSMDEKENTHCGIEKKSINTILQLLLPCSILILSFLFIAICYPIYLANEVNVEKKGSDESVTGRDFQFVFLSPSEFSSCQPNTGIAVFFACCISISVFLIFARKVYEIRRIRKKLDVTCAVLLKPTILFHGLSSLLTAISLIGLGAFPMEKSRPSYLLVHLIFELLLYHSIAVVFICWVSEEILWYRSFRSVPIWILWQLRCVVTIISVVLVVVFWVFFVFVLVDGLDSVDFNDLKMSIPITYFYEVLEYSELAMVSFFYMMVTIEVCYIRKVASITLKKISPIPEGVGAVERLRMADERRRRAYQNRRDKRLIDHHTSYSSDLSSSSSSSSSFSSSSSSDEDDVSRRLAIERVRRSKFKEKKKISPVKKLLKNIPLVKKIVGDSSPRESPVTTISSSPIKHPSFHPRRKRRSPPNHGNTVSSSNRVSQHQKYSHRSGGRSGDLKPRTLKRERYSPTSRNKKKKREGIWKKRSPRKKSRDDSNNHDSWRKRKKKKRVRFSDESGVEGSEEDSGFYTTTSSNEESGMGMHGLGFGSFGYGNSSDSGSDSSLYLNTSRDDQGFPNTFKHLEEKNRLNEDVFDRLVEYMK